MCGGCWPNKEGWRRKGEKVRKEGEWDVCITRGRVGREGEKEEEVNAMRKG